MNQLVAKIQLEKQRKQRLEEREQRLEEEANRLRILDAEARDREAQAIDGAVANALARERAENWTICLQVGGVIPEGVTVMVRRMVEVGTPAYAIYDAVLIFAKYTDRDVVGIITAQDEERIMLEGGSMSYETRYRELSSSYEIDPQYSWR